MTSIVGIRCTDGVVIAADSSATFGSMNNRTIEQQTDRKIELIGEKFIIAGTGDVGLHQRFVAAVKREYDAKNFKSNDPIEISKQLSRIGLQDFASTHISLLNYAALVSFDAGGSPALCELPGGPMHPNGTTAFQPEIKQPSDHLWFASVGSGQPITDPFLALFREIFWKEGPPRLPGGIFTAYWALRHACDVNPGGIKDPIRMAVLRKKKDRYCAVEVSDDELAEHSNMVRDATKYFAKFRKVLTGEGEAASKTNPPPSISDETT